MRLPWPPSVNKSLTVARGRKILSPKTRAWQRLALQELQLQKIIPFSSSSTVTLTFYPQDRRLFDPDNKIKAVLDVLQMAGILEDDNWKYLPRGKWRMGEITDRAFVEVSLSPWFGGDQPLPEYLNGISPF